MDQTDTVPFGDRNKDKAIADASFDGYPVKFGNKWCILPPLSVRQFRGEFQKLTADSEERASMTADEYTEKVFIPLLLMAFRRNYPEMTSDHVMDCLDPARLRSLSGELIRLCGGRAVEPGENRPGAERSSESTGAGPTAQ